MRTIWKFYLGDEPTVLPAAASVEMPAGARPLHVGIVAGGLYLWVLLDADAPLVPRNFVVVGTGQSCPSSDDGEYVGTIIVRNGWVLHVFIAPE